MSLERPRPLYEKAPLRPYPCLFQVDPGRPPSSHPRMRRLCILPGVHPNPHRWRAHARGGGSIFRLRMSPDVDTGPDLAAAPCIQAPGYLM